MCKATKTTHCTSIFIIFLGPDQNLHNKLTSKQVSLMYDFKKKQHLKQLKFARGCKHPHTLYQGFQSLFRCRIELLNFSMGFKDYHYQYFQHRDVIINLCVILLWCIAFNFDFDSKSTVSSGHQVALR